MENAEFEKIYKISNGRVADVSIAFKRYLHGEIDWDSRLIGVKGPRGTGKTTLLLQHMKESFSDDTALYVSLDNIWVDAKEIYSLAEYHLGHGGTHLFLDEVHKLEDWQNLLKSMNDDMKRLKVVYSGSSLLKLESKGGDLSRRQSVYSLHGLSFREYLGLEGVFDHDAVPLERLLTDHMGITRSICAKIPVLKHFDRYLECGYYPFYREEPRQYLSRVVEVVNQVLEVDYPAIEDVEASTVRKARRMLNVLAASTPQTPNMARLYDELGTDRKQGLKMLYALERAGLMSLLAQGRKATLKNLVTPDKIYCDNTNLMSAIVARPDVGTIRETFFLNQLRQSHLVEYPTKGDFLVDGRYLFEVGGVGKGFDQIKDISDSYVVNDGVEVGIGHKIPLWLFGFLY